MTKNYIVTNGKIYTQNEDQPWAQAFAVRDGRFACVGTNEEVAAFAKEAGLSYGDAKPIDAGGKFIMPALMDSHTHVGLSVMLSGDDEEDDSFPMYDCQSKGEVLQKLKDMVKAHPFRPYYAMFFGKVEGLQGEKLTRDDIDKIVRFRPVILMEEECHCVWLNSGALKILRIKEDVEDVAPGYSYYERDENGRLTGHMTEMTMMPILKMSGDVSKKEMRKGVLKIMNYLVEHGVTTIYDAGNYFKEDWTYSIFHELDQKGELPVRIEGTHVICHPDMVDGAVEEFKKLKAKYETENIRFKTMKMMLDGTQRIHTACMTEPYNDTGTCGGTLIPKERLKSFLAELNDEGIDFHVHTVGGGAVRMVLDIVEELKARPEGFDIIVTCAHNEVVEEVDLKRFAKLGVVANFTPSWNGGACEAELPERIRLIGEPRVYQTLRTRTVWDTGALITFSSDEVETNKLRNWNPFMGMEIAMTRQEPILISDDLDPDDDRNFSGRNAEIFPAADEIMTLEEMFKGYTINNAKANRLDDRLGSIEKGKEADFIVLAENPFETDVYELHNMVVDATVRKGKVINGKL